MLEDLDKNITILVVDDYAMTRDLLRSILKQLGFLKIVCAEDGKTALAKIRQEKIDLVICDWNMPKMSGLQVLKAIRADKRFHGLPFLMLTAEAYRENIVAAIKAGVSDYIAKPFTAETLSDKLENVLKPLKRSCGSSIKN